MISFEPNEDQQALREFLHRYAETDLRKHLRESDESGNPDSATLRKGWEMGVVAAGIDEAYGGLADEQKAVTAAIAYEELAWGDLSASLALLASGLLAYPVREFGSVAQKEAWLPPVCDVAAPALTAALVEPTFQFDANDLQTTAAKNGDFYVLNGKKAYVPLAADAKTILVYASENGSTQGYIVEVGSAGMAIGEREKNMGLKALATYPVEFNDCKVPEACRLGEDVGMNMPALQARMNVAMAALAVGMGRAAYEYALAYAKEREAFGEPIASRQSIAFMLAEMAMEVDAVRLMAWEAAWKLDRGMDANEDAFVTREYANEMIMEVADRALQILGGHGYIRDHPVELWFRNARAFSNLAGLAMV